MAWRRRLQSGWVPFLLAVVTTLALAGVRLWLERLGVSGQGPFMLLVVPVVLGAWLGGFRAGIAATIFSALVADLLFLEPRGLLEIDADEAVSLALYLSQGLVISAFGGQLRRTLDALSASHEELETKVERRTAELHAVNERLEREAVEREYAAEELRQVARRLEISNRELQDFASIASHDLQEPLRKIQAFGERLAATSGPALGPTGADYLGRMQGAAGRMQRLINDLLAFSRVTTKAQPFEPVDLARVAAEVLSDLEARIEQAGAAVEVGPLPTLDADPLQMRQLLQNLLGNALKFTRPEVPPVVRLWAEGGAGESVEPPLAGAEAEPASAPSSTTGTRDSEAPPRGGSTDEPGGPPDGHATLFVEDNGIGFEEKYLDRIFTVFQRLHGRGVYEGTGIGLAICRRIVERHGGTISARSRPGEGSTFVVTLPLTQTGGETVDAPRA